MDRSFIGTVSAAAATAVLPAIAGRALFDSKWRESLPERWGRGRWSALELQTVHPIAWFHAASVGEVGGLAPVVRNLVSGGTLKESELLITTTSLTGRAEVDRRGLSALPSCLLPLDHPSPIAKVLKQLHPKVFVISETEIWPNLLLAVHRRGIPSVIINGRISDFSFGRYRRLRSLFAPIVKTFDLILVQTEIDAERFAGIGAPQERIRVVGNTKYDQESNVVEAGGRERAASHLGIDLERPVVVAGSVRVGEEEIVANVYKQLAIHFPGLQMIIAPRHPERFEKVADTLESQAIPFRRRSARDLDHGERSDVLLLDTLGELRDAYRVATLSFVGGSLVPNIGGHNPLEPAAFSSPVVVGPHTENVRDIIQALRRERGLIEVHSEEALYFALKRLLENATERQSIGDAAQRVWRANSNATVRVVEALATYLEAKQ